MQLYPLFADLTNRPVLVVGGGEVAARKVAMLRAAGARVTVGAPHLVLELQALVQQGSIEHLVGAYAAPWIDTAWLIIAATDSQVLNATVAADGARRMRFVNVVDDPGLSSFQVPAVIDRSPLVVAISTGGVAPVLARRLREQIERTIDPQLGALLTLAQRYRKKIRSRYDDLAVRRRFYDWLHDGPVMSALRAAKPAQAEATLQVTLQKAPELKPPGSVVLVGAGPGNPDLLTLRALRALNEADVILYDALVPLEVLDMGRRDAARIAVGKRGGGLHTPQENIQSQLLAHARAGKRVVRLKGGDPFVFGRGGEELDYLRAHDIPVEVVPGITAAIACAAYTGVPLTHRDHAQSVRLITAHCRDSLDTLDWSELARERQTLAVYMAVSQLDTLSQQLIVHGRAASTPFVLVENGSLQHQRTLVGTLGQLHALAVQHGIGAPALLILGEVASLAVAAHWHGELLGAPPDAVTTTAPLADAA